MVIALRQIILRFGIALFSGLSPICRGFVEIAHRAGAFAVEIGEKILRRRVVLVGGFLAIVEGLAVAHAHADALGVALRQIGHGCHVAHAGRTLVQNERLVEVAFCAIAVTIA